MEKGVCNKWQLLKINKELLNSVKKLILKKQRSNIQFIKDIVDKHMKRRSISEVIIRKVKNMTPSHNYENINPKQRKNYLLPRTQNNLSLLTETEIQHGIATLGLVWQLLTKRNTLLPNDPVVTGVYFILSV